MVAINRVGSIKDWNNLMNAMLTQDDGKSDMQKHFNLIRNRRCKE